jgi:hypothetical protein
MIQPGGAQSSRLTDVVLDVQRGGCGYTLSILRMMVWKSLSMLRMSELSNEALSIADGVDHSRQN